MAKDADALWQNWVRHGSGRGRTSGTECGLRPDDQACYVEGELERKYKN